ncbi:hypothetical protein Tsubulata_044513, partial [Turnera subulata]
IASERNDGVQEEVAWGAIVEKLFIDVLVDHVNKGDMQNGQFNTKTTGFGWNPITNTVTAEDSVWTAYIQEFVNTGVHVNLENDNDNDGEDPMTTQTFERVTRSGKRTIVAPERKPKKKDSRVTQLNEAIQAYVETSKIRKMESPARVERYKSRTATSVSSTPGVDFSMTNCIQKLEAMDDISEEIFVKAVEEFKNQDSREAFIAMSDRNKKIWLRSLGALWMVHLQLVGQIALRRITRMTTVLMILFSSLLDEYEKIICEKNRIRTSSLKVISLSMNCWKDQVKRQYLSHSRGVCLEEKVAMTLFILGHNIRHRVVADRFQHSTETVQRHFKKTIKALCKLGREIIKQDSTELPDHIVNNPMYYPWFQNCLGAIDGTHISARAPAEKQ